MTWFPVLAKTADQELMVVEMETFGGSVEDVRAYCAVVEFGTVSEAARQTGETKGAVSRRLSRLERRLGVTLLARTARAVSPTEEGLAFHAKARDALAALDDAAQDARLARAIPHGHLRVTAPVDIGINVLPELLVRFRQLHPQITVELLLSDVALDLAAHRIDLALRATLGELPDMGYRASVIAEFHDKLYASPGYLAARGTPAAPGHLAEHDFIVSRPSGGGTQLTLTAPRGRMERTIIRPVFRTSDYGSALQLAASGGGIAPIPDLVAAALVTAGALRPVLPDWSVAQGRLHGISLGGREAPARVRVFREFVRAELRER
jgi:DNA-binding transcriptional LysR family regulator